MAHQSQTSRTILVTGGGGFLGKAIIRLLAARGDRVFSFSRNYYPELEKLGVQQIQGDIRDAAAVENACRGKDSVYHTAAKAGVWGDYRTYYQINTEGTLHVIAACRTCNVSRLIYTSSPSVIFNGCNMEGVDESCPYPETKALAEQAVRLAGQQKDSKLRTISLRPHLIWGPGDNHLVPRILKRGKYLRRIGDGKNLVDVVYIDNAAKAHFLAEDALIRNPEFSGNVYFISQGKPVFLWKMVDDILQAGGLPSVKRSISQPMALRIGAFLEQVYSIFPFKGEPPMTRFVARELSTAHWFDISAARRDLMYFPEISIEEGLRRLSDSLKPFY